MRFEYVMIFTLSSLLVFSKTAIAQSIQSGDSATEVKVIGNQLNIEGGQVSGKNQFHHFQTFNVNAGQTANFIQNNATIQNILSRVSGGTPSQIQGMIAAPSGVNLFLMNPAGIVFGNGASLNINGAFTATTANAIGFGNNQWLNAIGSSNLASLTGDPSHFAFTNSNPGAIVNTGNLTLPANKSLNLMGGTVINTGTIATPGGNITIAAVEGGKAVQISEPGSLLSYKLPIEALNAINPAIGNPVSLPELLTGSSLGSASGIDVKDGVVTLVNSQTQLTDRSGLAAISGTMSTKEGEGGTISIAGKTVAITNPSFSADKGRLQIEGDWRVVFEDQTNDELAIGSWGNTFTQVKLTANSINGVIESIDPGDKIDIYGLLSVSSAKINLSNLSTSFKVDVRNTVGVELKATHDITVGNVSTGLNGIAITSQKGNIKAGHIVSITQGFTNTLIAEKGSIETNSIQIGNAHNDYVVEGSQPSPLGLDVFAGKTFRVLGVGAWNGYRHHMILEGKPLFDFLSTKTGESPAQIEARLSNLSKYGLFDTKNSVDADVPASIYVASGGVRIRYMGGGGEARILMEKNKLPGYSNTRFNDQVILQGGNHRFEIGAKATPNLGDPYLPKDPNDSFASFKEEPFALLRNVNYQPITFSEGASGTVGGIILSIESNGQMWTGVLDRSFGIIQPPQPPAPPQPPTTQAIPTIDLENRNPTQIPICPPKSTIALTPPTSTRSPEALPSPVSPNLVSLSAKSNPCVLDNNDDEILKILK